MDYIELMKFIESEYIIINNTPCEICGGNFITEGTGFNFQDGVPSTVSACVCERCGNRKDFLFRSPLSSLNLIDDSIDIN